MGLEQLPNLSNDAAKGFRDAAQSLNQELLGKPGVFTLQAPMTAFNVPVHVVAAKDKKTCHPTTSDMAELDFLDNGHMIIRVCEDKVRELVNAKAPIPGMDEIQQTFRRWNKDGKVWFCVGKHELGHTLFLHTYSGPGLMNEGGYNCELAKFEKKIFNLHIKPKFLSGQSKATPNKP